MELHKLSFTVAADVRTVCFAVVLTAAGRRQQQQLCSPCRHIKKHPVLRTRLVFGAMLLTEEYTFLKIV
jgi:hypothetical protein